METNTLQQERRELWKSILEEVRRPEPDPASAAACSYLLGHLIHSAAPPRSLQIYRDDFFEDVLR